MNEDNLDVTNEEIESIEEQEVDSGQEVKASADEEKARRLGWRPLDEFQGDPDRWVEASEFLERGERQVPLLRANLQKAEKRIEQMEATLHKFAEHHKKTEENAYKKAIEDLKKQRAEALTNFDGEKLNEVETKLEQLREKKPAEPVYQPPQPVNNEFAEWEQRNQWALSPVGSAAATEIANEIRNSPECQGLQGVQFLDKVTLEVKKRYPQLFPDLNNPTRNEPAKVGSGRPASRKKQKSIKDLPQEAQQAFHDFKRMGLIDDEQQYIREYLGE